MSNELLIFMDGEFVKESEAKVSVFDHGVLYGDGIFEGIRAYNGRIFRLTEHINRLFECAKMIMLEIPYTKEEMAEIVLDSCRKNNLQNGYIRLVITRGKGDLGIDPVSCPRPCVFCIATTIQLYPEELYKTGIPVVTSSWRRNKPTIVDPQIKSLNYLNNIMAKMDARQRGCLEAIMLDHDGTVAECTGDNLFIVKNGVIYTPPIYIGALDGITRGAIFDICKDLGIELRSQEFTLFNVYNADECFLTGTACEAIAVTMADNRVIGTGKAGPITTKILEAFRKLVNTTGTAM